GGFGGNGDGGRLLVGTGLGDRDIGERGEDAGQAFGREIHRQLTPRDRATRDLLDEHRAEGAGRVDRRARGGCHRDDRREHHQTDGDTGESRRGLAVYHAEDGEHENERTHELGEKGLYRTDIAGIRRDTQAGVAGGRAEHADDRRRPDNRAYHLRGDVGGHA